MADLPPDPLDAVLGNSTWMRPILDWAWPGTSRAYLAASVQSACCGAYARARARMARGDPGEDQRVLVTAEDLLAAILSVSKIDPAAWTGKLEPALASLGTSAERLVAPEALQAWKARATPREAKLVDGVLRWDAVALLAEASRLRRQTNRQHESIGLRHVCFAALTTREGQQALQDLGLLAAGLPRLADLFSDQIDLKKIQSYWDDPAEWQILLAAVRSQRLLITRPARARSGFTSDTPVGAGAADARSRADPLGTQADAVALADLILLEAAEPPLAIGLFGSWGSGKSTLIGWLKQEVRRQTDEEKRLRRDVREPSATAAEAGAAADARDPQSRRVANVAQIEFNAWSFIDSQNLWASLTSEIFDQLRAGGAEGRTREAGRKLVDELAVKVTAKELAATAAETAVNAREIEFRQAEAELQAIVEARGNTLGMAASAVLDDGDSPLPPAIARALRSVFEGTAERSASGSLGKWRTVWSVWKSAQPRRAWLTAALAALTLCLMVVLVLPAATDRIAAWWVSLPGIGLLGTLMISLSPLAAIARAIGRYAAEVDTKNRAFEAEEGRKREALEHARAARNEALATKESAAGEAASLEATAKDPARLLTYLLTESADIQTVRGHLGVLGTVRRCFESLDELIQQQRGSADSIDRIVLYIDDLDRCSASQVVQILEAVHLLLAFKCFVVVVAIDARWLRRSLAISHPQFKPVTGGAGSAIDSLQGEDLPTPSDYLEKIFQIPFWVQGMARAPDSEGAASPYKRYVAELLGAAHAGDDVEGRAARDEGAAPSGSTVLAPIPPVKPDASEDAAGHFKRVQLTAPERTLLDALGPLAAKSPRAVKRLINIYRLIRARVTQEQEETFLAGGSADLPSFAAVQLALALDAGLPAHVVLEVRHGLAAFSSAGWQSLADQPGLLRGPAHKAFPHIVSHNPDEGIFDRLQKDLEGAGRLAGFVDALEAVKLARGGILDRSDMERAFALTQRYSFRPG